MLAHLIHDHQGKIRAAVFQLDMSGELAVRTDQPDDLITIVNLREVLPQFALGPEDLPAMPQGYVNLLTHEICERHRLDIEQKTLVPLS
jgi:hypothetical protein